MSRSTARNLADSGAFFTADVQQSDPALFAALQDELGRQQSQIELIASENIVSKAVLQAMGSVLTNKYAEGYPGRRYYGGCAFVDVAEQLAIDRAKALFGCGFANVQPHAGAQANNAVYLALMKPGDTLLGMSLAAGGHLTHGAPPNQSGKWFHAVQYGVRRQDARIDYDEVARLAAEHKPKVIVAGGSAYPRDHRLRAVPRDRRRGRRVSDGRHGAFRGAGRGRRSPEPAAPCPCGHDDDPQDAARRARRHDPVQRPGYRQEASIRPCSRGCRAAR